VENLQKLNIQPNDILIVLQEPPLENWGIRGGHPANEIDIGFELDV
jgi:phenylpyruvate tautomerase PptA (4-oxalocrotonate tautomerase family)